MGRTVPDHAGDVAKIFLDELLADPRAKGVLELVDAATGVVRTLQPNKPQVDETRELRRQVAVLKTRIANAHEPRQTLFFASDETLSREAIRQRRSALAALCHPDRGGSNEAMARINAAAEALFAELKECR